MRLSSLSLAVLYLFNAHYVQASFPSLVARAAQRAHRSAIHHSRGLAGDLRVAFQAVLVENPAVSKAQNRAAFCSVNKDSGESSGSSGSSGSNSTITSSGAGSSPTASTSGTTSTKTTGASSSSSTSSSSPWSLLESYSGSNFFDGWSFFEGADPTNGIVTYVDQATGSSSGLVSVNSAGHAIMAVETTPNVSSTRQSIRITTQASINGGLVILDAVHMPTGCGTWPAFWTNGPNWPTTGEIDIVEGVGDYTNDQSTIHTATGCVISSSSSTTLGIAGTVVGGTDCSALTTGNQGCGIRANSTVSFGAAFNNNGGGVYAMKWDDSGIEVYFFPRSSVPSDITANAPNPAGWSSPVARWPASGCNPSQYFQNHSVIFDTTLCGDWASGVWTSAGIPGQEQSCATRTGYPTCEAFVLANGADFAQAYWEVSSVQIYQASS